MLDRTTDPTSPHTSNLTRGLSSSIYLFVYVFDGTGSQLQHMGSSIFLRACGHSNSSCGLWGQFPDQGLNPGPLHWECRVPALDHQGSPGWGSIWEFPSPRKEEAMPNEIPKDEHQRTVVGLSSSSFHLPSLFPKRACLSRDAAFPTPTLAERKYIWEKSAESIEDLNLNMNF